jgi:hypothetical protein
MRRSITSSRFAPPKTDIAAFAAPRVVAGDFNLAPGASEISGPNGMTAAYVDLWTEAVNLDFRFGCGTFTHPISRHALICAGSTR